MSRREQLASTIQLPVDQGGCPKCGHPTILLKSGNLYCPDENCHPGGHVVRIVEVVQTYPDRRRKAG